MGLFFNSDEDDADPEAVERPEPDPQPAPEPERGDQPLSEQEQRELLEDAMEESKLDPDKEITGEDLIYIMNNLIEEAGLTGDVGFTLWDTKEYDVLAQTQDIMIIGKVPGPHNAVDMPMVNEARERIGELKAELQKERGNHDERGEQPGNDQTACGCKYCTRDGQHASDCAMHGVDAGGQVIYPDNCTCGLLDQAPQNR